MYLGISMESFPGKNVSGGEYTFHDGLTLPSLPCTSTVLNGSIRVIWLLRRCGSTIVNFTSEGRESGASPIREAHGGVMENGRTLADAKAGMRNSGNCRDVCLSKFEDRKLRQDPICVNVAMNG